MRDLRILEWRTIRKISQEELARRIGATQGYISAIETGRESPTVRMLLKIANALDIPICYLFHPRHISKCKYYKRMKINKLL